MTATLYSSTLWPAAAASSRGAVLRAAEEVIAGTIGSIRTVTAGHTERGAWDGASDEKMGGDALVKVLADVRPTEVERTGAIAPETCSLSLDRVALRIRLVFTTPDVLDADTWRNARAACWAMIETIQDALAWAGNLTQTSAAVATNLVGAALIRSGPARILREDRDKRLMVAEFVMTGLVQRTRAVA